MKFEQIDAQVLKFLSKRYINSEERRHMVEL